MAGVIIGQVKEVTVPGHVPFYIWCLNLVHETIGVCKLESNSVPIHLFHGIVMKIVHHEFG